MPPCPPVRNVDTMNTATPDDRSSRLRVSDADRDGAIAELSTHFQAGRRRRRRESVSPLTARWLRSLRRWRIIFTR